MRVHRALWLIPLSCVICSFAARTERESVRDSRIDAMSSRDEDKEKDAATRRILAATHAGDMGKQIMQALADQLAKLPSLPAGFMDKFMSEVDVNELVEMTVPIYKKHYDLETLQAVANFYESPVGKKFIAEQAVVVAEATAAGQEWGQSIAKRVVAAMKKEDKK